MRNSIYPKRDNREASISNVEAFTGEVQDLLFHERDERLAQDMNSIKYHAAKRCFSDLRAALRQEFYSFGVCLSRSN